MEEISANWYIDYASAALIVIIVHIVLGFVRGQIEITSLETAHLRMIIEIMATLITILLNYMLYGTFKTMGQIMEKIYSDPEIMDTAIRELEKSQNPVKPKDFAKTHNIPFELLMREITERIIRGELKGNVINDTFYPYFKSEV